ncbi:MAG TPA: O-methyltransferase [Actinomycetes bacterium]|jgi:caffeoyl-CoA O-methyltransferase|nr:O-methyltransferase [Actinomycetes bacterium]
MTDIEIADPRVEAYAVAHSTPEPPWFAEIAEQTRARTSAPGMMVGTLEGRLLKVLVAILQPTTVLEIGTFTGYSSLSMAEALPPDGRIITCDISEEHVALAREHIGASPYADRIEIRVGPATETLATLDGPFDLVFIDADKPGYLDYYEAVLPKLSGRGLVLADNVLWSGRVLDDGEDDENTRAIRAFNDHVLADQRVEVVMLTVRDGLSLIRRRSGAEA